MAFDPTPSAWIASWSEDGSNITVPIASFAELTDTEADGTTGDIRKIMFAVVEQFYQAYNAEATADRPTQMRIYKSASINPETSVLTNSYTFQFTCGIGSQEVSDEPT